MKDKDIGVRYTPQTLDGRATMEQQLLLLARNAHHAWDAWCERDPEKLGAKPTDNGSYAPAQLVSERLNAAMRLLYSQLREVDIFMSGVSQGRQL